MSPLCLLFLLGAVGTSQASFQFISQMLKKDHEVVAHALKLTQVEFIAGPLFSSVIRNVNSSCQRRDDVQMMSTTLDVYDRIFSSIQKQKEQQDQADTLLSQVPPSQRSEVESALQHLQQRMKTLKGKLKQMNEKREEELDRLKTIEVDDVLVQKKALAQFKAVYQAASLIGHCGHALSD
uniref:Interferon-gamma 1 n=1 Tax=Tetraodon nigroviridis TaxID=99883 RepID=A0A059UDZ2_TETNG|nr:interferon-gamma 1 [Tetraodon nigroviridis]